MIFKRNRKLNFTSYKLWYYNQFIRDLLPENAATINIQNKRATRSRKGQLQNPIVKNTFLIRNRRLIETRQMRLALNYIGGTLHNWDRLRAEWNLIMIYVSANGIIHVCLQLITVSFSFPIFAYKFLSTRYSYVISYVIISLAGMDWEIVFLIHSGVR